MIKFICEHCGQEFYRKQNKGQRFCSNKCRALSVHPNFLNNENKPPNYDESKIRYCLICGKKLHHCSETGYCKEHFIEYSNFKKNISIGQKKRGAGGYHFGAGGGIKGKYDNVNFDSSWELAFYIYHKENNLYIERCKEKRTYIYNEKQHNYYPDFVTDNGIIEIKGYDTEISKQKSICNPDVKVIHYPEIKKYLNYVINKYGKQFYKLFYETS